MFHSAKKLKTFNRCFSVAPRNTNVMFVRFSRMNGPKDCVFFQPWCVHCGCMFSFDSVTVWVGMRICWLRSNWENWRGRRRKLKEDVGLRNNKKGGYFRLSLLTLVIAQKEERERNRSVIIYLFNFKIYILQLSTNSCLFFKL